MVRPVLNAMEDLQAYIYKSVNSTGLFKKTLVATRIIKLKMLMLVLTVYYKIAFKNKHYEFENICGCKRF